MNQSFMVVPVGALQVDAKAQRSLIPAKVITIAAAYDEKLFGALVVSRRPDGGLFVCDGQHRLAVAVKLGLDTVPCIVMDVSGDAEDAKRFIGINTARKAVKAMDKWRVMLTSRDPACLALKAMLDARNLVIANGDAPRTIQFVGHLLAAWSADAAATARALDFLLALNDNGVLTHTLFNAANYLERFGVSTMPHAEKVRRQGGFAAIAQAIRTHQIETGFAGSRTCAAGLLAVINHKNRKRIALPVAGD